MLAEALRHRESCALRMLDIDGNPVSVAFAEIIAEYVCEDLTCDMSRVSFRCVKGATPADQQKIGQAQLRIDAFLRTKRAQQVGVAAVVAKPEPEPETEPEPEPQSEAEGEAKLEAEAAPGPEPKVESEPEPEPEPEPALEP